MGPTSCTARRTKISLILLLSKSDRYVITSVAQETLEIRKVLTYANSIKKCRRERQNVEGAVGGGGGGGLSLNTSPTNI